MPTATNTPPPRDTRRAAPAEATDLDCPRAASASEPGLPLRVRAVGRARVYHTRVDILQAVLAGLRRL
ncbi:hypothetical protein [Salinispora arenicola]|uniref:hypothetical protein n=1 Tax=Salinispora arenicola TaxID=168697 RepID=UPI0009B77000|nr:hypothetical protein [Salinispora arenicola]